MLIVGSHAWDFGRDPVDYDYIATWEEFQAHKPKDQDIAECYPVNRGLTWVVKTIHGDIEEYEIAFPGSTAEELLKLTGTFPAAGSEQHSYPIAPSIDVLYTLKMSHRFLKNSPAFYKTMGDIKLLRAAGAEIFDEDWYKRRMKDTYWYEHPNLDRSKDEFFGADEHRYYYVHDDLHEVVAVGEVPAYTKYGVDGKPVQSSKKKFFAADLHTKLSGVYEEACVLALERAVVPFGVDPDKAFRFALMKVCTSITSGWFREFAWENHDKVVALHEALGRRRYVDRLLRRAPVAAYPDARNALLGLNLDVKGENVERIPEYR